MSAEATASSLWAQRSLVASDRCAPCAALGLGNLSAAREKMLVGPEVSVIHTY